ncbi:MAG: GyrI-like domain-containing protein [Euryarchaeota archaeon]|nr:GyrI-like domain-containing protein [Euryarchaeota archaeon]MBU4607237.1 GyrI-like domain-containing protein [Euryarchaeota archaeon]MBV1729520.1 GyrI-like domain-containing protein [Methanobacterium sp.]MBV1754339.1 GyrI-like domain-containing protein [Methanobacterium sp.]
MEIKEKSTEKVRVVYRMCRGSYQKIPDYIQEVGLWLMEKNLTMTGMVYGTYYNSPDEVLEDELEYEIGFSFKGKASSDDKFMIKEIKPQNVISAIHKGPYTEVGPVIHGLADYAIKNSYEIVGPVTEIYLNDPSMEKPEDLLTEVQFPVSKE